jgi:jumonji domain-containing protein 7
MQKGDEGVIAINYWYDMDYSSALYPTVGLYRRLITGVIEGNHDLLKDEEEDNSD